MSNKNHKNQNQKQPPAQAGGLLKPPTQATPAQDNEQLEAEAKVKSDALNAGLISEEQAQPGVVDPVPTDDGKIVTLEPNAVNELAKQEPPPLDLLPKNPTPEALEKFLRTSTTDHVRRNDMVKVMTALLANPNCYPSIGLSGIVSIADQALNELDQQMQKAKAKK